MRHLHDLLVAWGPPGLLVLSLVESAGIPNPGGTDALILVVTIARPSEAVLAAVLAVIGSLIGTLIFFEISRKGGQRFLAKYTSAGRGLRVRTWFQRYGLLAVFIPALLPIPILPFKALVACAGAMHVSRTRFLLVLLGARIARYGGLAYLGVELGENSTAWLKSHVWHMLAVAAVLFLVLFALIRRAKRVRLDPADGISPERG